MLAVTPQSKQPPPSLQKMPFGTPATIKASRIAETGLAYAEALESSGLHSDRHVASLKAKALEEAAEAYKRQRDTLAPKEESAASADFASIRPRTSWT